MASLLRIAKPIYIVAVEADNPRHHGLHTTTAPHLLTFAPAAGDRIVHVIDAVAELDATGQWQFFGVHQNDFTLRTHPGRSALLGEDGLDSVDEDGLGALVLDWLRTRDADETGHTWRYAPCTWELADAEPRARGFARRESDGLWLLLPEAEGAAASEIS